MRMQARVVGAIRTQRPISGDVYYLAAAEGAWPAPPGMLPRPPREAMPPRGPPAGPPAGPPRPPPMSLRNPPLPPRSGMLSPRPPPVARLSDSKHTVLTGCLPSMSVACYAYKHHHVQKLRRARVNPPHHRRALLIVPAEAHYGACVSVTGSRSSTKNTLIVASCTWLPPPLLPSFFLSFFGSVVHSEPEPQSVSDSSRVRQNGGLVACNAGGHTSTYVAILLPAG